ncbi:CGNR zinc finger domain-containing protein [Kribbella sandramycini]|uniref:CGNR zinc finger domain-containing protein n=2 Tax=Kribbella sandramycini TaxID=60450 RepID=A0A7Y4L2Q9_9ACTN|nr:CGNR zinc finger domain-containing protein [Kribbella sandramycini]NOL43253.1 CGNR zinc finger domain-containing protein [Kribbella sandramycini]
MLGIAVDLVNERPASVPALRALLVAHGEPEPIELSERDLVEVRAVAQELRPVFGPEPAVAINALLREYAVQPYLTDHDGTPWHLHVSEPDASWAAWLAAGAALALAGTLAGRGPDAVAECAASDCERVFVNSAAKRPRRFCTPTCAGRTRVAAHRARRASGGGA